MTAKEILEQSARRRHDPIMPPTSESALYAIPAPVPPWLENAIELPEDYPAMPGTPGVTPSRQQITHHVVIFDRVYNVNIHDSWMEVDGIENMDQMVPHMTFCTADELHRKGETWCLNDEMLKQYLFFPIAKGSDSECAEREL